MPAVVAGGMLMYGTYAYLFVAFAMQRFSPSSRKGLKAKKVPIKNVAAVPTGTTVKINLPVTLDHVACGSPRPQGLEGQ